MKLAVIGTFYKKYAESQRAIRAVLNSERRPDEFWIICETIADLQNAEEALGEDATQPGIFLTLLSTPKNEEGTYAVIPYSNKINFALDASDADAFVYLDNGSIPHPQKYGKMLEALLADSVSVVYCSQERTGFAPMTSIASAVVPDAFSILNFTQVMHRRTSKRWPLDMSYAVPHDLADAYFWRELHSVFGPFFPVCGEMVLDWHHIPSSAANGL